MNTDENLKLSTTAYSVKSTESLSDVPFKFPSKEDSLKKPNWALIGYVTRMTGNAAYKLYYRNYDFYYEYSVLVENDVFVVLEPKEQKIRDRHVLADGEIPSKAGQGTYLVHLYEKRY